MTAVIRYVTNTLGAVVAPNIANSSVDSSGSDYQILVFSIVTPNQLTAGTLYDIFDWNGAGKVKSVVSMRSYVTANGTQRVPGADIISIATDGKSIRFTPVTNNVVAASTIILTLVIGNY